MEERSLVSRIVDLEWEMFSEVQNIGGTADCQHNPGTFRIMRESQLETWDETLLQSYLDDLRLARADGRNLMTEKYAYMMRETHPDEFERIKDVLPERTAGALDMIQEIITIHRAWQNEVRNLYPVLLAHVRPAEKGGSVASLETYMRGELLTYSDKTISLYLERTRAKRKAGQNEAAENLLHQVSHYGFSSLDECEAHLRKKAEGAEGKN
ncbi:MAG: DUF4125 family protein [Desulfovibrio sp.]|nr:DUF4125 family protein [Desulfovibrio sp.]